MMKKLALLLIYLITATTFADDIAVVENESGKWLLHIPDTGTPYLTVPPVLNNVSSDPNPPVPGPNPDPPPSPPNNDPLRESISSLARKVEDPQGSLYFEEIYKSLKNAIDSQQVVTGPDEVSEAFTKAVQLGIKYYPGEEEDEWRAFHKSVALKLATMINAAENRQPSKEQYVAFFNSCEAGLRDTHADNLILDDFLQELLQIVIRLLLDWITNQFSASELDYYNPLYHLPYVYRAKVKREDWIHA